MHEEPPERNNQITSRLPPELRRRLDNINRRHKTTDATVLVELLQVFANEVEREDAVRFPVTIILAAKNVLKVAEGIPEPSPTAQIEADEAERRAELEQKKAARKPRGAGPRNGATGAGSKG